MGKANLAVVARRSEPEDSLDYFPTPPWATRAFIDALWAHGAIAENSMIWEPACGEGHMAAVLAERFTVFASDIFDYGYGAVRDFLAPNRGIDQIDADWIITNPPFNAAMDFAATALARAREGVALLVRLSWLEGGDRSGRYEFFQNMPPSEIFIHAGRVPMHRGRWEAKGSTATAYAWVVWRPHAPRGTHFHWIRPDAKKVFSRRDDVIRFGAKADAPLLGGV